MSGGVPPGAVWLPAQGPVQGRCDTCFTWGFLVVEHRMVWGVLGELPDRAPQVRDGCPGCADPGDPQLGTRLVAKTNPPASLAGMFMKLSASEVTWLECKACGYDAPCHFWAWMVCTAPGCSRTSRAKYDRPKEKPGGSAGNGQAPA